MSLSKAQQEAARLAARGIIPEAKKKRKPPRQLPAHCQLESLPQRGRFEVAIPHFRPHYLNELKRVHYMVERRMKWSDAQVLGGELRKAGVPRATGRRRLTWVLVMGPGQRRPDPDAIFKSGNDGLKRCGALVDDNPTKLDLMPTLYEKQSESGVRVILEDI